MIKKIIKRMYFFIKKVIVKVKLKKILKRDNREAIFLIGSPLHGNIGDHAISIAEMKFLESIKEKKIIEIPGEYYNLCYNQIKEKVREKDIIIITGGGFMGSLWMNEENMVRHIVKNFIKNKVVIMPQTVFFEDNDKGKEELKNSKEIYENHPNLYLCVRENNSFNYCKKYLSGIENIILVPDIVIYLDYQQPKEERDGVLFCLRKDKEKVISDYKMSKLIDFFEEEKIKIKETTTVINKRISFDMRMNVFENKLLEFKKSKLLITDRLHGMIFAAITATPCIAMNNLSGKVKGVYQWLKDLDYIKFIEDDEDIEKHIKELLDKKENYYNSEVLAIKFNIIKGLLR